MKIYYDSSLTCTLNPLTSTAPFTEVSEDFKLTKNVDVVVGHKQKEDPEGNPLYLKDVFSEREIKEVVGYDDTTRKTDSEGQPLEPLMITVQKENEDCEKLYYETVEDEEGFRKVETTKVTEEPVMIETQKVTPSGKPVYKLPIIQTRIIKEKTGEEEVTEVTSKPAMEDILEEREVSIFTEPHLFKITEVIQAKVEFVKKEKGNDLFYEEFITTDNIQKFQGNTGLGFIQLAPKSKLIFKPLSLSTNCNTIELLDFKGDKNIEISVGRRLLKEPVIELVEEVNQLVVSLSNNTNDYLVVSKLAILATYKEQTDKEKLEAKLASLEENQARMQSVLDDILLGGGM